jgi:hypothetical protein
VDEGELRRVQWPTLELVAARLDGPRDVVLLIGPEPDMRWEQFTAELYAKGEEMTAYAERTLDHLPPPQPETH